MLMAPLLTKLITHHYPVGGRFHDRDPELKKHYHDDGAFTYVHVGGAEALRLRKRKKNGKVWNTRSPCWPRTDVDLQW